MLSARCSQWTPDKILISLWMVFLLCFALGDGNPCNPSQHTIVDDFRRHPSYVPPSPKEYICDRSLPAGWYRFMVNGTNAVVPTTCPNVTTCGTQAPIWIRLSNATPDESGDMTGEACAAWIFPSTTTRICCILRSPARIRNCGAFAVYHIRGMSGCNLAYCALPVEDSQERLTGAANLAVKPHKVRIRPRLRGSAIWLSCTGTPAPGLLYNISWYKHPTRRTKILLKDLRDLDEPVDQLLVSPIILGTEVSCSVVGYNRHTRAPDRIYDKTSKSYFVGIKARTNRLRLAENGGHVSVKFISTIPVSCPKRAAAGECHFQLSLSQRPLGSLSSSKVALSKCELTLRHKGCSRRCAVAYVNVTAPADYADEEHFSSVIEGFISSKDVPLWDGYSVPPIKVKVSSLPTGRCYSFAGVKYTSYGGTNFPGKINGTFLLHKSTADNYEIQVQTQRCYKSQVEVCTCGLVARDGNSIVKVDMCHSIHDVPSVVAFDLAGGRSSINILKLQEGRFLLVKLTSGAYIQIILEKWGMSYLLTVPAMDESAVQGLCTYGGEKHGDPELFLQKLRLQDRDNLFHNLPDKARPKARQDYCTCSLPKHTRSAGAAPERASYDSSDKCSAHHYELPHVFLNATDVTSEYHFNETPFMDGEHGSHVNIVDDIAEISRKTDFDNVRRNFYELEKHREQRTPRGDIPAGLVWLKGSDMQNGTLHWPTPSGLTESHVRALCMETIENGTTSENCSQYISDHLNDILKICMTDVTVLDDPLWAVHSVSLIEMKCEEEVALGADPNIALANPFDVMRNIGCPNDCSGHGVCNGRECFCDEGYVGTDCSETESFPPVAMATDGICDTITSRCDIATVYGSGFRHLPTLSCIVTQVKADEHDAWAPAQRSMMTSAMFLSSVSVDCSLPDRSFLADSGIAGHTTWEIKVSNDNTRFSNPVYLTVFDSSCENCAVEGDHPRCHLKGDRCLIDGACYDNSEPHPKDFCLACLTEVSAERWSQNPGNSAPSFVDPPTELEVLSGQPLTIQLKATDADGIPPYFRLGSAPANVSMTYDGLLTVQIISTVNASHYVDAIVFDECDSEAYYRLKVTVIACPCQNGGTCENWTEPSQLVYDIVYCTCPAPFTGKWCDAAIDPCQSNPCVTGQCVVRDLVTFQCLCPHGVEGNMCEIPADPCLSSPCVHGECMSLADSVHCVCDRGFTGEHCETPINPCVPNPCSNNGQCIVKDAVYFRCQCDWGFTGVHCENLIDPCTSNPCYPGVGCSPIGRNFMCDPCPDGLVGDGITCEDDAGVLTEVESNVITVPATTELTVTEPRLSCASHDPCFPGVKCSTSEDNYVCGACPRGMTGNGFNCSDICEGQCRNGGVCTTSGICRCPLGYSGAHCERVVCTPPCENGGTCLGRNRCKCRPGLSGTRCSLTECSKSCLHGGLCIGPERCACSKDWTGRWCQEPVCDPPCINGGTCIAPHRCLCPVGVSGAVCEISECVPPCMNDGQCLRPGICKCAKGWMGRQCTKPLCDPVCLNGGKCVKRNKCSCPDGWTGRRCERPICVQKCRNGGSCVKPNVCDCAPGYHGSDCSKVSSARVLMEFWHREGQLRRRSHRKV